MSDIAIRVEHLGKQYRIGGKQEGYRRFTEAAMSALTAPMRRLRNFGKPAPPEETFWALRDVSFEVKQGEAVGIIGRNGAGKSTLLKVLSRITEPTTGQVELHGRVSSLLEVGTGFHPELTGRENIYLNGTILGMRRAEIDRKFDEIVAFSGVEKFLDTPVKHYSSGMQVRLAFSVAAHLEPEILLIDEVLAVGDAEFQKKCLGKMGEVAQGGRTVLFVSHNMAAIAQLCQAAMLIDQGMLKDRGCVEPVVKSYLGVGSINHQYVDLTTYQPRRGTGDALFEWVELRSSKHEPCRVFSIGEDVWVAFSVTPVGDLANGRVKLAVQIRNSAGVSICNMVDSDSEFQIERLREHEAISVCLKDIRFYPDNYHISLWVGSTTSRDVFDHVSDCLSFEVKDGGRLTTRYLPRQAGILFLTPEWHVES